jgi:SAM-dependent methyltransferase
MDEAAIRSVVEGELGLIDMPQYVEYKKKIYKEGVSLEEIERLSPDRVDSSEFWKYCHNAVWKNDTICFGMSPTTPPVEVNRQNMWVAGNMGAFSLLSMAGLVGNSPFVLDIGAGFGMLKDYLKMYVPNAFYAGVDVYPRFEGVTQVKDCILPSNITELQFDFVFSVNVFQHLSVRQRRMYYEQVAKLLRPQGVFIVSNAALVGDGPHPGFWCRDNGKKYVVHYGQFTEVQHINEIRDDIGKHFRIHMETYSPSVNCFLHHLLPIPPSENKA